MKRFLIVLSALFVMAGATFSVADEIGPAKPNSTNSTTQSTVESDSETTCSLLEKLLGKCE